MVKFDGMGPKPIHDVAPPGATVSKAGLSTKQPAGPEIVSEIPVRQPSHNYDYNEEPLPPFIQGSDTPISDNMPGAKKFENSSSRSEQKDNANSKAESKTQKPSPVLATVVFLAALICLVAGTYLKFVAN